MTIPLIPIIVAVLIAGVALWAISQLPGIDETMKRIARVLIVVVVVIYVIVSLFGGGGAIRFTKNVDDVSQNC